MKALLMMVAAKVQIQWLMEGVTTVLPQMVIMEAVSIPVKKVPVPSPMKELLGLEERVADWCPMEQIRVHQAAFNLSPMHRPRPKKMEQQMMA